MITLYGWGTPNFRKISIAMEELSLPYEIHKIDIMKGEQFTSEFLAINPNNKIPAIVDDDGPDGKSLTLFESGAILMYLANKTGRLMPSVGSDYFHTLQWLMFQMGGLGPMLGQMHHYKRYAKDQTYGLTRYTNETHRLYKVLDGQLKKKQYIAGSDYSIADIAIYPWIARFELHDLEWSAVPNVKRWYDMVGARSAVKCGMEIL